MVGISMPDNFEILKFMRGETSQPLLGEVTRMLQKFKHERMGLMTVQVESQLVSKGLTLFVSSATNPTAVIFLARKEIPGFIPLSVLARLHTAGWIVVDDSYQKEFSVVSKKLGEVELRDLAGQIVQGLEALGAPQKHVWQLNPEYWPKPDVSEKKKGETAD
jgi:hypothetical protein